MEDKNNELKKLFNREEVLQICYWYQGEGLGDEYNSQGIETFLNCGTQSIIDALDELSELGYMSSIAGKVLPTYQFTDIGKKAGGRLFADSFSELQKSSHGECAAGCCDGDDHSACGDGCELH